MEPNESFTFGSDRKLDGLSITIPIWALWPIIVVFISATAFFVNTLNAVHRDIEVNADRTNQKIDQQAALINARLDSIGGDRWRRSHEREWANQLQRMNPDLNVPNVDDVANKLDR